MFKLNFKLLYCLSCLLIGLFLFGCKKIEKITVFDKLPDSELVSLVKTSLKEKKPIVIAFTAEWCPHCKAYKPLFSEVKDSFTNKATFINVDVDDKVISDVINRFQVRGIPTTAFIRQDGSIFKVQVGEIDKDSLIKITNDLIVSKRKSKDEPVAPFPIGEEVKNVPTQNEDVNQKEEESKESVDEATKDSGQESEESAPQENLPPIDENQDLNPSEEPQLNNEAVPDVPTNEESSVEEEEKNTDQETPAD